MPTEDYLLFPDRQGKEVLKAKAKPQPNLAILPKSDEVLSISKPQSKANRSEKRKEPRTRLEAVAKEVNQPASVRDSFGAPQNEDEDWCIVPADPDYENLSDASPLKERSPNSPIKPIDACSKPSRSPTLGATAQPNLTEALSTLLAHQKSRVGGSNSSTAGDESTAQSSNPRRGKRKLFGRATSNLSAKGGAGGLSFSISRASSVDTMNTDGLGTPIEITTPTLNNSATNNGAMENAQGAAVSAQRETISIKNASLPAPEPDALEASLLEPTLGHLVGLEEEQPLQMTQVGYEDPEAGVWRAKLAKKMNGKGVEGSGKTPKKKSEVEKLGGVIGTIEGRRTRGQVGR